MPIAASSPLMTLFGTKLATEPPRNTPSPICSTPATSTAARNTSKLPSPCTCATTIAARPAAGPVTLTREALSGPTTRPPRMPEINPDNSGAPEAWAMPRHNGRATRKTTSPASRSRPTARMGGTDKVEAVVIVGRRRSGMRPAN